MAVGTPYRAATAVANTTNNATVAVTTNVNVPAGDTLFLMVLNRLTAAAVVTSISGATASEIISFKHPTTTMGVSIIRIYAASQINSGTVITCTLDSSTSRKVLHAWGVPGLANANVDTTNSGGASSTTGATVASGNTGSTTQADAIAIYADGYSAAAGTDTFTPAGGYTEMDDSLAGASSWPNLETAYKILAATGVQSASATHVGTTTGNWVSLLGVWKGVASSPTIAIGKIASPAAVRGLAFVKQMAIGKIASVAAVRGLAFVKLMATGHITGPKAVRGLAFTKLMAVGHITGPKAVRGLALTFQFTMAIGKIAARAAVRGATLVPRVFKVVDWRYGGDSGGGFAHVGAAHPWTPNLAALCGDIWGAHNTFDRGASWWKRNNGASSSGAFDGCGMAWSLKNRWRCYILTGVQQSGNGTGALKYFDLNDATQANRWKLSTVSGTQGVYGGGSSCNLLTGGNNHKRAVGRRIVVDYDVDTGTEYVYWLSNAGLVRGVDTGSGLGSLTLIGGGSINAAQAWASLALAKDGSLYLASYRTAADYALNTGSGSQVFRVTSPRTAASGSGIGSALGSAPGVVEELYVDPVTGDIWAACGPNGVYVVTANGATWTQQSAATFSGLWCTAVFKRGATVMVGTRFPPAGSGKSLALSTNSGGSWAWQVSTSNNEYQSGVTWWLSDHPDVMLGGDNFVVNAIEMDCDDPTIIYIFGRSGVTMTRDGGTTWKVSSAGANGGVIDGITPGVAGAAAADNLDWGGYDTTDHFTTVTRVSHTIAGNNGGPITVGGHTYQIVGTTPKTITRDGVDISDDVFMAATHSAAYSDLQMSDDGVLYVGLDGGGTLVGWMRLADVGHVSSPSAVRGLAFSKLIAIGKTASTKAVRGLLFAKQMAVGHITGPKAVRGLLFVKLATIGKVVGPKAVRGLAFAKLMALGKVVGPKAVRGLAFTKVFAIGKALGLRIVRGLGLTATTPPAVDWSRTVLCECYDGLVESDISEGLENVEVLDILLDVAVADIELDLDLADDVTHPIEVH